MDDGFQDSPRAAIVPFDVFLIDVQCVFIVTMVRVTLGYRRILPPGIPLPNSSRILPKNPSGIPPENLPQVLPGIPPRNSSEVGPEIASGICLKIPPKIPSRISP